LAPQPLSRQVASYAILAAVASNTPSKLAIGALTAGGRFAAWSAAVTAAALAAGATALVVAVWTLAGER
jgi:uncharacterized membrane protein (DUF4010 family)